MLRCIRPRHSLWVAPDPQGPGRAEIWRLRVEKVKQLLRETDWSLSAVALKAGFRHPEYLSVAFKREVWMTPGAYRAEQASLSGGTSGSALEK